MEGMQHGQQVGDDAPSPGFHLGLLNATDQLLATLDDPGAAMWDRLVASEAAPPEAAARPRGPYLDN